MSDTLKLFVAVVGIGTVASAAPGTLAEFASFSQWQTAAGSYTTIRFDEIPAFSIVTTQYQPIGVTFVGGLYQSVCCSSLVYPQDGTGLDGNGWVTLVFSQPMMSIAAHYPGALTYELYHGTELIALSTDFFVTTPDGHDGFAGVLSSRAFDRVILKRGEAFGDQVFLDNLYFGRPIPGPAALTLMTAGVLTMSRRRRS